jgi:hypothetical protein
MICCKYFCNYEEIDIKIKFVSVSDVRREYSKNNAFAVNHMMSNIMYGTVFEFLGANTCRC